MRGLQRGFTYLMALVTTAVIAASLLPVGELWSHAQQREKEAELLWIGNQFRQAITLYYYRSPGALKRYPEKLDDLLEDKRYLSMQRYLRRIYTDPMTGKPQWGLVSAPEGGIMGVYSLSERTPVKTGNFATRDQAFAGAARYADWKFTYEPPQPTAGTASAAQE